MRRRGSRRSDAVQPNGVDKRRVAGNGDRLIDGAHLENKSLADLLAGGKRDAFSFLNLETCGFDSQYVGANRQKIEAELPGSVGDLLAYSAGAFIGSAWRLQREFARPRCPSGLHKRSQ